MNNLLTGTILALLVAIGLMGRHAHSQTAPETCGAAPAAPPQTEAWAVQVAPYGWRTEVPGWVAAPAPVCWILGQVELTYPPQPAMALDTSEPGPWIEGVDYPLGDPCPEAAQGRCSLSPNTPKPVP